MKHRLKIFLATILLGLFVFGACEENFLEVSDPNRMTSDQFWQTEDDAKKAIVTAYSKLQMNMWWGEWGPSEMLICYQNLKSDEIKQLITWGYLYRTYQFEPRISDTPIRATWSDFYQAIYHANLVLENVPDMSISQEAKDKVMGEALFIRGYAHFFLLNNFGNIVLRTEVPRSNADYYKGQSSKEEVYEQIEEDLASAADMLPQNWDDANRGRATKGAATGMLGKVYMYQSEWTNAITQFRAVTSMGYSLVDDYESMFNGTNKNSSEALFEIQFSADNSGGQVEYWGSNTVVNAHQDFFYRPSDYLHNLFMNDLRADGSKSKRALGSIIFNDPQSDIYYFEGRTYEEYLASIERPDLLDKSIFKKYAQWEASWNIEDYFSGANVPVLRYADILLMLAEALNENGQTGEAIDLVNQVRARAEAVPVSGLDQDALRQHIRHVERPLEFSIEGNRFFDLVRWGEAKQVLTDHGHEYADQFETGVDEILPIPSWEMDSNPNVIQNPGY